MTGAGDRASGGAGDGAEDATGTARRTAGARPARAWQRMLSGRRLNLLDPTPMDVEIGDIAHGLAFVARWNGQTQGEWPYTVAGHSLLVEQIFARDNPAAAPGWRLAALLHDAPEYVIGDMISPVKSALGPGYAELDQRLAEAIHRRFSLPAVLPARLRAAIKAADRISARLEAEAIAGFSPGEAARHFPLPRKGRGLAGLVITLQPPSVIRKAFLDRFDALMRRHDAAHGPGSRR